MLGALVRLVLIVLVLVAVGAFFLGYRWDGPDDAVVDRPVPTTGEQPIDTSRARKAGAEIGERLAVGASEAQEAVGEAALTAKIKSKMALDDTIEAAAIDVDTDGSVVTLRGRVSSDAARARALQLARETEGVTSVVDQLSR
jgi:osmotically-inducible protein OsmY